MTPKLDLSGARALAGLGLGLGAAGLTAAAGFAADRIDKERRVAQALDMESGARLGHYEEEPDEVRTVLATDGVALHVEVDEPTVPGSAGAPTVVFCHGYCLSLRSWVFQRRALKAAGYRVVLWDQRGHGSSGQGSLDSYDIDQLGRDLDRLLAEVVPDGPVVLVGHSMGGMTIMAYALEFPEKVAERVVGVGLVATSTGGLANATYGLGAAAGRLVHLLGPATTARLARVQGVVDASVRASWDVVNFLVDWGSFASPVPMSVAELTTDMIASTRMDVIAAFMPRFDAHDKAEALEHLRGVEALVLNGAQDKLTAPSHSDEIARLLPQAEHVVVEDAGHIVMLEHPTLVNEQLLRLVRRAGGPGAGAAGGPRPPVRVVDMAGRRAAVEAGRRAVRRARPPKVAGTKRKDGDGDGDRA